MAENLVTSLAGIKECPCISKLDLSKNKIESIEEVPELPCLTDLNLAGNPISKMDSLINLKCYTALRSLNLTECTVAEDENLRKEVLIMLDGLKINSFNGEEVTEEDLKDAHDEKENRIKEAEEAKKAAAEAE